MHKPSALFGDEFATFRTSAGHLVAMHLESRAEITIDATTSDRFADIALEFRDDHEAMRAELDDSIARVMVKAGVVRFDEWSGTYRTPSDIAESVAHESARIRERLADIAAYHASVL